MSTGAPNDTARRPSVFLSYASEDRVAAKAIRDVLPTFGLDVWYDESGLDGGDAWDQKIRRQIRECDFFMPVISAQTQVRHEGYFRREWRLAVERTLDMADDHIFLLPVVVDETAEGGARVPEKFLSVQWSRLPQGASTPPFEALCRRLAAGQRFVDARAPRKPRDESPRVEAATPGATPAGPAAAAAAPVAAEPARDYPEFPREEEGQRTKFFGQVALWSVQSAWIAFRRFPKWIRIIIYVWLAVVLLSHGCGHSGEERPRKVTPADSKKLKEITDGFENSQDKADAAKLVGMIAQAFPDKTSKAQAVDKPLLAIPFNAPSDDAVAKKLADAAFAQVYGSIAISHRGQLGLSSGQPPPTDPRAAADRGHALHSKFVLYGGVENEAGQQSLVVRLVEVDDHSLVWSGSYPVVSADPARIAEEVESKVPDLDED